MLSVFFSFFSESTDELGEDVSPDFLKNEAKDARWALVISCPRATERSGTFFFCCPGVEVDFPDETLVMDDGDDVQLELAATIGDDAVDKTPLGEPVSAFGVSPFWGTASVEDVGEAEVDTGDWFNFFVKAVIGINFPVFDVLEPSSASSVSSKLISLRSFGLLM